MPSRLPRMLVAPDSFKGSLSAPEVAAAIALGIRQALPGEAQIAEVPMADGGEGTLDTLTATGDFERRLCLAHDPLGRPITAHYAVSRAQNRAVVELAAASGLPLLTLAERDPLRASTQGTGEVIRQALADLRPGGEVLLCLGGSATNDAGAGLLSALGARFLDADGQPLPPGGLALRGLHRLDLSGLSPQARQTRFRVACDVTHPLTGPGGASAVFGPQKGASAEDVGRLDAALEQFAGVVAAQLGQDVRDIPGTGAAGGTAAGVLAVLGARLEPGAALVAEASGLSRRLAGEEWQLVWTGEGRLDHQSQHGKVVSAVAGLARQRKIPVVALAGAVEPGAGAGMPGLSAAFAIAPGPLDLDESRARTAELLTLQAAQVTRLWWAVRGVQPIQST